MLLSQWVAAEVNLWLGCQTALASLGTDLFLVSQYRGLVVWSSRVAFPLFWSILSCLLFFTICHKLVIDSKSVRVRPLMQVFDTPCVVTHTFRPFLLLGQITCMLLLGFPFLPLDVIMQLGAEIRGGCWLTFLYC